MDTWFLADAKCSWIALTSGFSSGDDMFVVKYFVYLFVGIIYLQYDILLKLVERGVGIFAFAKTLCSLLIYVP